MELPSYRAIQAELRDLWDWRNRLWEETHRPGGPRKAELVALGRELDRFFDYKTEPPALSDHGLSEGGQCEKAAEASSLAESDPERCPTCGSPKPEADIVTRNDVPLTICPDPFHGSTLEEK